MAFDAEPSDSGVDVQKWKERKFPKGSSARAQFEHLSLLGCDPRGLLSFLTVTVIESRQRKSIYELHGVSQAALVKLPERLEKIAGDLEAVNPLLGNYVQALFVENPDLSDQVRSGWRRKAAFYQDAPKVLRSLAIDLRAAHARISECFAPKRYDFFRHMVLDLLDYVNSCTGSPHYQEVADLLSQLHSVDLKIVQSVEQLLPEMERTRVRGKKCGSLKLLTSADALKALYLRSAKYDWRKARQSKSKRPPSA